MKSTSLYRYRISKKCVLGDDGRIGEQYYPQYQTRLFGWCPLKEYEEINPLALDWIKYCLCVLSMIVFVVSFVFLIHNLFFVGILCSISSFLILYFTYRKVFKTADTFFYSKDDAEQHIKTKILIIQSEIQRKKSLKAKKRKVKQKQREKQKLEKQGLPKDKIYYLDLKIERYYKLKKLRKFSFLKYFR